MDNKKWNWLRWIGVLPCAICTIPILLILNHLLFSIIVYFGATEYSEGAWIIKYITPALGWFYSGISFIASAKYIAPSHKKIVGISFFALVFILGIVAFNYLIKDYFYLFTYTIFALASGLSQFINFEED